ncbi:MAG: phage portal protein, partial [Pseudobutyrivibrio sp.]|nr:phage portal protein [Pseudobutyrivibrio sp.]
MASSYRPDRVRLSRGNERSIITSVYNQISIMCAKVKIKHVRLDKNKQYVKDMDSGLNECLTLEANIDQTARAFRQDIYLSLLDEGCVAIVPVDTSTNPDNPGSIDIITMRTARVIEWYPRDVKVNIYNDRTGKHEEVIVPKSTVAIVENPLYAVVNEPNSVMQRLIRKLNILDAIDEQSGSGKLDIIIQLPYIIKTESRRRQAEQRRNDIINQLSDSDYGIAYTDGTEKI